MTPTIEELAAECIRLVRESGSGPLSEIYNHAVIDGIELFRDALVAVRDMEMVE